MEEEKKEYYELHIDIHNHGIATLDETLNCLREHLMKASDEDCSWHIEILKVEPIPTEFKG